MKKPDFKLLHRLRRNFAKHSRDELLLQLNAQYEAHQNDSRRFEQCLAIELENERLKKRANETDDILQNMAENTGRARQQRDELAALLRDMTDQRDLLFKLLTLHMEPRKFPSFSIDAPIPNRKE